MTVFPICAASSSIVTIGEGSNHPSSISDVGKNEIESRDEGKWYSMTESSIAKTGDDALSNMIIYITIHINMILYIQ